VLVTKDFFLRREFSFTLADDVYIRYQSFRDASEMAAAIQKKQPEKIDIGAVFSFAVGVRGGMMMMMMMMRIVVVVVVVVMVMMMMRMILSLSHLLPVRHECCSCDNQDDVDDEEMTTLTPCPVPPLSPLSSAARPPDGSGGRVQDGGARAGVRYRPDGL
jgi:hypothetical protein